MGGESDDVSEARGSLSFLLVLVEIFPRRAPKQLPQDAIERRWVNERDQAISAGTGFGIDEVRLGGSERREVARKIRRPQTHVVQSFPPAREESCHAACLVRRLNELDARRELRPAPQEDDADRLVRELDRRP